MKIKRKDKRKIRENCAKFDENIQQYVIISKKALEDNSIKKILKMREEGLISRPTYNLKNNVDMRVLQFSNLK